METFGSLPRVGDWFWQLAVFIDAGAVHCVFWWLWSSSVASSCGNDMEQLLSALAISCCLSVALARPDQRGIGPPWVRAYPTKPDRKTHKSMFAHQAFTPYSGQVVHLERLCVQDVTHTFTTPLEIQQDCLWRALMCLASCKDPVPSSCPGRLPWCDCREGVGKEREREREIEKHIYIYVYIGDRYICGPPKQHIFWVSDWELTLVQV